MEGGGILMGSLSGRGLFGDSGGFSLESGT